LACNIERKNHRQGQDLKVLFIVSPEVAAGKTALCAGLAVNFLNDGLKVGYLKSPAGVDGDTAFMKQIPGLDIVSDVGLGGYDIILVEGRIGTILDDEVSQAALKTAQKMKADVIAVEAYSGENTRFLNVYKGFGGSFLGIVVNKVPGSQLKRVRDETGAHLTAVGLKLLGVIPENRVLVAVTVGELAASLKGKILNHPEKSDELVENYMLGALVVDSGADYFARKARKAAIIRHDRPDMQLAALETSTSCLVLGGSEKPPIANVLFKAESCGIPIIATDASVSDIAATIEDTILKTGMNQAGKLPRLAEAVGQNLDVKALART
jgi:BioD-like phosphotransacetylase family protein